MSTLYDAAIATYAASATGLPVFRESGAPQNSRSPYITYYRMSQAPQYHTKGLSALESVLYRIVIYTVRPDLMGGYETALSNALHGYRGAMGDQTALGTFVETISSDLLVTSDGGQPSVHTREYDVTVWFARTPIQR
jgi:hypothetical protein